MTTTWKSALTSTLMLTLTFTGTMATTAPPQRRRLPRTKPRNPPTRNSAGPRLPATWTH